MDSIFSAADNRLSFGFSKTQSPSNVTTDWCHYTLSYGADFPDYPKLGDSRFFIIIGVNTFGGTPETFIGSDLIAISKPPSGTTCPAIGTFKIGTQLDLRDTGNLQVFTPVPANQIDRNNTGFVMARNGALPSNRLWFFNVTRNAGTGNPVFGSARRATVASYAIPPNATQPTFTQTLDTLDARPTQAVQALNPNRNRHTFWTQHTVADAAVSGVRWYEIDPLPATPQVRRTGIIRGTNIFVFNGAISPDRRVDGATSEFGNSFVIQFNLSSATNSIAPRIAAKSSFNGGALTAMNVRNGVGGYRDFSCPSAGNQCRWGDYAAANPDPRPGEGRDRGVVWGTNQYSGVVSPSTATANWRTWIFSLEP
jgi:hypothetical protein